MPSVSYFLRRPGAVVLVGVVAAMGGAFIAWKGLEAMRTHREQVTMKGADLPPHLPQPGLWVKLTDVAWDCTEIAEESSRLIVTGSILPPGRPIVAFFPRGVAACAGGEAPEVLEGVVHDIWPATLGRLRDVGFPLPPAGDASVLELWVGQDASSGRASVIGGLSFTACGAFLTAMGLWMRRGPRWYLSWRARAGFR